MTAFNKQFYVEEGNKGLLLNWDTQRGFSVKTLIPRDSKGKPKWKRTGEITVSPDLMQKFVDAFNELFSEEAGREV